MPRYHFQCEGCDKEFAESLPLGTTTMPACHFCKHAMSVRKMIKSPMVHFKGSGFYKTDSAKTVAPIKEAPKKDAQPTPATPAPKSAPNTPS